MKRRDFLTGMGSAALAVCSVSSLIPRVHAAGNAKTDAPFRLITKGPKFHWGAYYDQIHFDPTNRIVIGNEVDFEGRSPLPTDRINVGLIDTQDNDRWTPIGSSVSWNWQLGCMLQWIPGNGSEVIWNDRKGNEFISHIYNYKTGEHRDLPAPVYALSPNGKFTVFPDYRRLNDTRPGYGYCGIPDPNGDVLIPKNAGIWKMDLQTGERRMLFSFADIAAIPEPEGFPKGVKHWFNHLIVSPDSKRFLFLHRWQQAEGKKSWFTRMLTANADGSDIHVINHPPMTSHLVWRDPSHIIAYAHQPSEGNHVYLFEDKTGKAQVYGKNYFTGDTHISFVPGTKNRWALNDTYPRGKERMQTVFLYNLETEKEITLGKFHSPKDYTGEWRTDLHPRCSRDGKQVLVDTCTFGGRQIGLFNIDGLTK
ncbi:MAG: hypothetical protein Q4G69_10815 [Planctomycetia bacterium]|nr:hypothetical protein [Planctomycetia bacterium]